MASLCDRPGRSVHRRARPVHALLLALFTILLVGCPAGGTDSGPGTDAAPGTDSGPTADSGPATDSGPTTDSAVPNPCINVRSDPASGVGVTAVCGFGGTAAFAITSLSGELIALPGLERLALPFPMGAFGADPQGLGCGPTGLVWITLSFGVDQLIAVDVTDPGNMSVVKMIDLAPGATPRGLSFGDSPTGDPLVYVANSGTDTITVVDADLETIVTEWALSVPGTQAAATPLDVLVNGDRVFVANAAVDASFVPGVGFITVMDRTTGNELSFIDASQPQPGFLSLDPTGALLLISNNGIVDFFGGPTPTIAEVGGLDVLVLATADTAVAPDANLPLTPDMAASPIQGGLGPVGGIATGSPDGEIFGGSALTGDLYRFDLVTNTVTRDTDGPVVVFPGSGGFTGARVVNGTLAVSDFSTDDICFTDDPEAL